MNEKSRPGATSNPGWFRKGRSGNRNGRPRALRASRSSALEVLVEKTVAVAGPSGTREIAVEEALEQQILQDALAGKRMAIREVGKWIVEREAWLAKHEPGRSQRKISILSSPDPDNADAALLLLGITAPDPAGADHQWNRSQRLLEPWAVQAALRRRRGGNRLTDKERDDIRRLTLDPNTLRWPRGTDE